jgi:hypothetical protein
MRIATNQNGKGVGMKNGQPKINEDLLTQQELDAIMRVPTNSRRYNGRQISAATMLELRRMADDPAYVTNPRHRRRGNAEFIRRHKQYLESHLHVNPFQYLSNLRIMTRSNR